MLSYRTANIGGSAKADPALVRDLQSHLRALGYLYRGIDGQFGPGTRMAVRRLQFDLMRNDGRSRGGDGEAPIKMMDFNRGVVAVTGVVDPALADSIESLLDDARVPKLPRSDDPVTANRTALTAISAVASTLAPTPFVLAVFQQESDGRHYTVPQTAGDSDTFITIGLDTNSSSKDEVTSRGYGIGQYTLFHHPPRPEEVAGIITDPVRNARYAHVELRDKFDHFVAGSTAGTQADDRAAEHPILPLRLCRYSPGDARYMRGCRDCAIQVGKVDIAAKTALYHEATQTYGDATDYWNPHYVGVPDRAQFLCDWPYAVRRYNGSGPNSFNYQARILLNLLASSPA